MSGVKVYLVDVGVLLTKKDDKNSIYFNAYDKKYGYYNEKLFYKKNREKAKLFINQYVSQGVENTYGIVIETYIDEELIARENDNIENIPVEYDDSSVDDIIYSMAKIDNQIVDDFIVV